MFSSSQTLSTLDPDFLSDEELVKLVEDLKKKVDILRLENEVLEQSILRLQPSLMDGITRTLEYAMKFQSGLTPSTTKIQPWKTESLSKIMCPSKVISTLKVTSSGKVASGGRITSLGRIMSSGKMGSSIRQVSTIMTSGSIIGGLGPKVNVEGKLELVHTLMEIQGKDLNKCKNNAKKKRAFLTAQFEEIDLRIKDVDKLAVNFNQQVVIDGWDPIGRRIPAEVWIKFLSEQAKKTDRQMDKLRIRVSTLNSRFSRLKGDIKRKEELRSNLFPVDFDQKKIEIKENLEIIALKNVQLVALKEVTGDANLCLTIHKKQMFAMEKYLDQLIKLKDLRKQQTIKTYSQKASLQEEVDILEQHVRDIKKLREYYLVPDVNQYIAVKARVSELINDTQKLEVRLKIKQFTIDNLKRHNKRPEMSETESSDTWM